MSYNTGNPSGSSDPRDLSDSSSDIDTWATSTTADTHPDRLGTVRKTWRGMENEFDADQVARASEFDVAQTARASEFSSDQTARANEFDADQDDRTQRFDLFLANSGYQFVGNYAAGIELTEYNQVVRDVSGNLWRVSASTALPYTTTGVGLPEGGAFIAIGDADLAQNLISDPSTGQGALLVRGSVIYVDTIADLQALPTSEMVDGQEAAVHGAALRWDSGNSRWQPGQKISIEAFGAKAGGIVDNAQSFADMYSYLENYAGIITASAGRFYTNGSLKIPLNASFEGAGEDATIIDAKGSDGIFEDNAVLLKKGIQPTAMVALASDVSELDTTITFASAHDLSAGDVFLIYNPVDGSFSDFRPTYRDGEYCTVAEVVNSTTVELEKPLYASHSASVVDVYRCDGYGSGHVFGVSAIAPGAGTGNGIVQAMRLEYLHKLDLLNVAPRGSDNASGSVAKCYKVTGRAIKAHQWGVSPGFGTQYGMVIGNSQQVDLTGEFVGYRHGIATGGGADFSIPCRDIHVHDFVAKNALGAIASADWHGNTERSSYRNGTVYGGGLNIAGNRNVISGIQGAGSDMIVIYGREILGCDHVVQDIDVLTGRDDINRGLIDIGGNAAPFNEKTVLGGTFNFKNIKIKAPNATRSPGITVRNRGSLVDWHLSSSGVELDSPVNSTPGVVRVSTVSGAIPLSASVNSTLEINGVLSPLSLSTSDASCKVRGVKAAGIHEFSVNTSQNAYYERITLPFNMPNTRYAVQVTISHRTTGTDRLIASGRGAGLDAIDIYCVTADAANFSANADLYLSWTVSIDEF